MWASQNHVVCLSYILMLRLFEILKPLDMYALSIDVFFQFHWDILQGQVQYLAW